MTGQGSIVSGGTSDAASANLIAEAYDSLPYQSKSFPQSTPEQLAIMARLFKLDPPDITAARVLEIGCAAGGNIIPLAALYPRLHAVGVDLSSVQIAEGKAQVDALGIRNCELHCLDVTRVAGSIDGPFDYIICHGVFSWVPEPVRQAILSLIHERLSPNGVAYVSYNVYPGWRTREIIRDMMLFHAGGMQDPVQRLEQAKAILAYTKNAADKTSVYGKMLAGEAAYLSNARDDYLMHEYLSPDNRPMYFREFIELAAEHQLAYLGEAELSDMAAQRLGTEVFDTLATLSGGDILATEQYMDFFINRTFRQTLLVHRSVVDRVNRRIEPEQLDDLLFTTHVRPDPAFDPAARPGIRSQYVDDSGRTLSARGDVSHALLSALTQGAPWPLSLDVLLSACRLSPALAQFDEQALRARASAELLNLLMQGMLRLHAPPAVTAPKSMDKPQAWPLARLQAQAGQVWATNMLHEPFALSAGNRAAMALMDGQRGHADLQAALQDQLRDGSLNAMRGGERITNEEELAVIAKLMFEQALRELSRLAVLM